MSCENGKELTENLLVTAEITIIIIKKTQNMIRKGHSCQRK